MKPDESETRVLLVEDNPGDARLIRHHFRQEAFTAVTATVELTHVESLEAGLSALAAEPYDCVFLDLGLPESSGLATLERVLDENPSAPIVVLTGLDDDERAVRAIQEGAEDYLVKDGIDTRTLARSLRYSIERKAQERALRQKTEQIEFFNSLLRHDMGNDLQLIRAKAATIADEGDGDVASLASDVVARADEIIELTSTVRQVLAAVSSEGAHDREVVNLVATLESEVEGIRAMDADVSVSAPSDVYVYADELLGEVLKNVLSNAVAHGGPGVTNIEVSVTEADGMVRVTVADDGPGIEDPERVLERGETAGSSSGTGFGLYFVSSMLDAYGGDIEIGERADDWTLVEIALPTA